MSIRSDKKDARCIKLKRERGNLYEKRSYYNKRLTGDLDDKARASAEEKLSEVYSRIDKLNPEIYRCGQRWEKLDSSKKNAQGRRRYRVNKIAQIREEAPKDQFGKSVLSEEETKWLNQARAENRLLQERINDVNKIFGYGIKEEKGVPVFSFDEITDRGGEALPIWRVRDNVMGLLETGIFKTVDIDGEILSGFPEGRIDVSMELEDFRFKVESLQGRGIRTPWALVLLNNKTGHIKVEPADRDYRRRIEEWKATGI